ncbi:MAG: NAD(P)/FAD-dependent oxidoreductase [Chloroflexi bacterium]|nr:NAD(P)/FAD-dependent oxidoreductase [Chloroflexota bacterium]
MRDELIQFEGFSRLWGRGVYHCPYCDGWEVRDLPLAVYGKGEDAFRRTRLLTAWSRKVSLYSDGPAELSLSQRQQFEAAGITLNETKIRLLAGEDRLEMVIFEDGREVECRGCSQDRPKNSKAPWPTAWGLNWTNIT